MENCVYVLFNKLSKRYESVMSFPSDEMAIFRLKSNIELEEYDVCRVGTVSIETGVISPCPPIRLVFGSVDNICKEAK